MQSAAEQPDPAESILGSIARTEELRDILVSAGDITLDAIFDSELVQRIPILGTLCAMGKAAVSIRDRLFAKKMLKFLIALDSIPQAEREAQLERLASDPKERQRVGEHLILLIDRLNDMRKPELLARAFEALLAGKIDRSRFQRLAQAIDIGDPDLLQGFPSRFKDINGRVRSDEEIDHFLQCGLVTMRFSKITTDASGKMTPGGAYMVSDLGYLFEQFLLRNREPLK